MQTFIATLEMHSAFLQKIVSWQSQKYFKYLFDSQNNISRYHAVLTEQISYQNKAEKGIIYV
jgi:hypothetical protein